jgi:hypothetical protein
MSLFRFKRRVSFVNAYGLYCGGSRFGRGMIEVGAVFDDPPTIGYGVLPEDVEQLPDPRDDRPPSTILEVVPGCDALLRWIGAAHVPDPRRVVAGCLRKWLDVAAMLPDAPPTPFDAGAMRAARTLPELVRLVKLLRQWAADSAGPSSVALVGMSCQQAAERMEQLRIQGEPFTSQHKLAKQFGCSSGTINKAIKETLSLRNWAERKSAAPKAQSLYDVVTDGTAQSSEPNPEDEAAIREYLERDLTPNERAFFNGLSREHQLYFLNDPDKHQKILGRQP